jgi:hypothetical protein
VGKHVLKALCLAVFVLAGQLPGAPDVELFDTDREQVVKTLVNTEEFQAEGKHILASANGRVLDLNPSLEKALIVKIPLAPPQKLTLRSARIEAEVTQLFVVMPKQGKRPPWLILHTKQNESILLEFSAKLKKLQRLLGLTEKFKSAS